MQHQLVSEPEKLVIWQLFSLENALFEYRSDQEIGFNQCLINEGDK